MRAWRVKLIVWRREPLPAGVLACVLAMMLRALLVTSCLSAGCGDFPVDNDDNQIVFHRPDAGDRADARAVPIGIDASVQPIDAAGGGAYDGGNATGAPYVTSFSPTGNDAPEDSEIWVTFSEEVTNVRYGTFQLYVYDDGWWWERGTVTYEPSVGAHFVREDPHPLGYGVDYMIVLAHEQITDLDGNQLIDPGPFYFCSVFCDYW